MTRTMRWLVAALACALAFAACDTNEDTEAPEGDGSTEEAAYTSEAWTADVNQICEEIAADMAAEPAPQPTGPRTEDEIFAGFSDAYAALQDELTQIEALEIPEDNPEAVEDFLATYHETEKTFGAALEPGTVDEFNTQLGALDEQLQELDHESDVVGVSACGPKSPGAQFRATLRADGTFTDAEADCIWDAIVEYAERNQIDDWMNLEFLDFEIFQQLTMQCLPPERNAEVFGS